MAASETARLIASLELKDKLSKGVKNAQTNLGKFESRWDKLGGKLKAGLAVGATGLAVFGASQIKAGLESLTELENAVTQVDGALDQVAPTWKTTGAEIAAIADRIEANVQAAFDDKAIIAGAGALIRYGKVSEANLEPALQVMTDLAAKTGDIEGASQLLAKALADPAKAAGKLAKVGVVLTKQQQDQIKVMTEAGDVAGAQALLLENLSRTTSGAAKNLFGPAADAQNELNDAVEDGQKVFAQGFLPVIQRVRQALGKGLADPATMGRIRDLGKALADGFDSLLDIAGKVPWGTIGDSLAMAGQGAKAVLSAFTSLPPWVQTAVITGWGLNKVSGGMLSGIVGELGKGLVKGVLGMTAGVVHIKAGTVVGAGGATVPGAAGAGGVGNLLKVAVVGSVVVAGLAAWMDSIGGFAAENGVLKEQGLNAEEIAAMRYYTASAADQATMAKRIGRIPDRADYESALAKQAKTTMASAQENAAKIKDEYRRKSDEVKSTTTRGLQANALQTARGLQIATNATQTGSSNIVSAVNRIPAPITNIKVNVSGTTVVTNVSKTQRSAWRPPSSKIDQLPIDG